MVVKKFTSEFEVKFIAELGDTLLNVFRLYLQILVVVKSVFHNGMQS